MKLISILVILATLEDGTDGRTCGERQYENKGICCDKCRPGQYVKKHCSASNFTTCESCQVGTIMRTYNDKSHCDSCPYLQYYDINLSYCMNCRACPKGEYPVEKCSTFLNTKCQECPEGHHSNITENYNFTCKPCKKCKHHKRNCTPVQDAVCSNPQLTAKMTATVLYVRKPSVVRKFTTEKTSPVKKENSSKTQDNTFLILAVVLSIVFVLALVIIYWCARRKSRCQGGDGFLIVPRSSLKYEPLRTGLLLRNQPASFFLKLVGFLNPDSRPNWKDLAANFKDFTWSEIENFAVDKNAAAEKMLCAWQTKNTSTVDKLHECLTNIKREDVATYVAEFFGATGTDTPV